MLYKIDGGIDHILVDEAQDTNPEQWTIIERLAEEFFAGEGRERQAAHAVRRRRREAVDLQLPGRRSRRGSATVGRAFRAKAMAIEQTWNDVPLTLSFRSTEADAQGGRCGVQTSAQPPTGVIWHDGDDHRAPRLPHRPGRTGRALAGGDRDEDRAGRSLRALERGRRLPPHAVDVLCKRIAGADQGWLDNDEELESEGRKIKAGDILILVRRRDPFTAPMIRALEAARRSPVAGADRMQLLQQIAVQDLMALADVLLMPEDDLSLAVVLKSPLFGLDDDDLFELAFERRSSLVERRCRPRPRRMRGSRRLPSSSVALALARRSRAALRILPRAARRRTVRRMRKRMLTRLGPEAAEAIDEFLDLALGFDREAAAVAARLRQRACARPTSRSSATWSRSATRSAS